jgi:hypothetical protein
VLSSYHRKFNHSKIVDDTVKENAVSLFQDNIRNNL